MTDRKNNRIFFKPEGNGGLLVVGKSGFGKTYYLNREIEAATEKKQKTLVIDYSGSFTKNQLEKAEFKYLDQIQMHDVSCDTCNMKFHYKNPNKFEKDIADSLVNIFSVKSMYQIRWMRKAVSHHIKKNGTFVFAQFFLDLEDLSLQLKISLADKKDLLLQGKKMSVTKEDVDNVNHLVARFMPYEDLIHFGVSCVGEDRERNGIEVMQLSKLPKSERSMLTKFLLEMLWKETLANGAAYFGTVVLDEIQHLSLKEGSTMYELLHEGRKFGQKMILATQHIANLEDGEREALDQLGNTLIFHPTKKDRNYWVNEINESSHDWEEILRSLPVGKAVLLGGYSVNNGDERFSNAIICNL